jgi:hypothetical protein
MLPTLSVSHGVTRSVRGATHFEPSNKEPISHQLRIAVDPILQERENAPANVQHRDKPMHGDFCEKEHERDLTQDCSYHIDGLDMDKLIAVKALARSIS